MMILLDKVIHAKSKIESIYSYRSCCYKLTANKTDINRVKERFDKSKDDLRNILNETVQFLSTSD